MGITSPASAPRASRLVRRHWAAAALLSATPALAACGAGFSAQTSQIYQAAEGSDSRSGGVYSLNTLVVADGEGSGTVVAALINQQAADDTLVGFSATDSAGVTIPAPALSEPIVLPAAPSAGQSVQVGTDGALRLEAPTLLPGGVVDLTLTFANAEPVLVTVPVVDVGTVYADIPVGTDEPS